MLLTLGILAALYLVVAVIVGFVSQMMNPTGDIHWGPFAGVVAVVWLALAAVTIVIAAIVGGLVALF